MSKSTRFNEASKKSRVTRTTSEASSRLVAHPLIVRLPSGARLEDPGECGSDGDTEHAIGKEEAGAGPGSCRAYVSLDY